jgi:hypothetical protein
MAIVAAIVHIGGGLTRAGVMSLTPARLGFSLNAGSAPKNSVVDDEKNDGADDSYQDAIHVHPANASHAERLKKKAADYSTDYS